MSDFDAVIESDDELHKPADDSSSDDLRSALEASLKEVTERQRDEHGRFAPKAAAEAVERVEESPAPAPVAAPEAPVAVGVEAVAATPVVNRAPDAWSPAAKAKFATLDPEIQAEIARREVEVHKGFTKQDEQRNLGKAIEQTYAPYMAMVRAEGGDPVRTTQNLLQTAYTLRHGTNDQKVDGILGVLRDFQIDPNQVFQRLAGGQQQPQSDPQVVQLRNELAQLQRAEQERQQSAQSQEKAQILQAIESFASDPKHTYYSNVKPEMAALLNSGRAKDMQEAYDMACWARPDIRPLLQQQIDLQKQNETRAKAAKARAAGSSITGSPSSGTAAAAPIGSTGNLRDDLTAVYREIASRD